MRKILIPALIIVFFATVQGVEVRAKAKKTHVVKGTILMETFGNTSFLLDTGKGKNAVSRDYSFSKKTIWISLDGKKRGDANILYNYGCSGGDQFIARVTYIEDGTYMEDGKKLKKRLAVKVRLLKWIKGDGGGM